MEWKGNEDGDRGKELKGAGLEEELVVRTKGTVGWLEGGRRVEEEEDECWEGKTEGSEDRKEVRKA